MRHLEVTLCESLRFFYDEGEENGSLVKMVSRKCETKKGNNVQKKVSTVRPPLIFKKKTKTSRLSWLPNNFENGENGANSLTKTCFSASKGKVKPCAS